MRRRWFWLCAVAHYARCLWLFVRKTDEFRRGDIWLANAKHFHWDALRHFEWLMEGDLRVEVTYTRPDNFVMQFSYDPLVVPGEVEQTRLLEKERGPWTFYWRNGKAWDRSKRFNGFLSGPKEIKVH